MRVKYIFQRPKCLFCRRETSHIKAGSALFLLLFLKMFKIWHKLMKRKLKTLDLRQFILLFFLMKSKFVLLWKQRLKHLPLVMWSQAFPLTLTNQFCNISFWAVMKPLLKHKGEWGGVKRRKGRWKQASAGPHLRGQSKGSTAMPNCGHSAGTQCGRWDANFWSPAKDL